MTSTTLVAPAAASQVVLGLGEWRVTSDPDETLVCLGLGSCVALCLHDRVAKIGGMAHMVLPDSTAGRPGNSPAKFVDLAVPALIDRVIAAGAKRSRLNVALAGGASMLAGSALAQQILVGERNIQAAREALTSRRFQAHGEDTGGSRGRTVRLHIGSGTVTVAHAGDQERVLQAGAGGSGGVRRGSEGKE